MARHETNEILQRPPVPGEVLQKLCDTQAQSQFLAVFILKPLKSNLSASFCVEFKGLEFFFIGVNFCDFQKYSPLLTWPILTTSRPTLLPTLAAGT